MKYRLDKHGEKVSTLGYGCMRFSKKGGSSDLEKTEKEIRKAIELGVNYFDTAYIYGDSEETLGKILAKDNLREKVKITTKLPHYLIGSEKGLQRIFDEQLRRLQTDYVDYYLMHMLTDIKAWEKLKRLGILDWINRQKEKGTIKNIGFSYHGGTDMFLEILNDYDWDLCQIQYNYMDEHAQAGRRGLQAAYEKGVPVIIMEPLRGGKLVNMLPQEAVDLIKENNETPASFALKWLYDQKEVTCVLSGMNSLEMIEENCHLVDEVEIGSLTESDQAVYQKVRQAIQASVKIGCTECGYCMPCPHGVMIPDTFRAYNRMYTESKFDGRKDYYFTVALKADPGLVDKCINCHVCESHCPQHLEIPTLLKQADRELFPPLFKTGVGIARKFMNRK